MRFCILKTSLALVITYLSTNKSFGFTTSNSRMFSKRSWGIRESSCLHSTEPSDSVEWPFAPAQRSSDSPIQEEEESGDVQIPSAGISVSDEMDASQKDRFVTELISIKGLNGVAQLVSSPLSRGSFEPVRYLVSLSPPEKGSTSTYVLVDVPPFSPALVAKMRAFMGKDARLAGILVTNRDAIHHDEAPSVFSTRRADLTYWKQAFPEIEIVAYRLDTPRDCRESVTQVLDGYGPFAMEDTSGDNITFVESGRSLTVEKWDHDVAEDILRGEKAADEVESCTAVVDDAVDYSPEAIRAREEGKKVLAVFTPGHTFGSISYIFPEQELCCSGFTIPVEDTRAEQSVGMDNAGPALDCRGYVTTSRAGISRQVESAKALVETYADRFKVILPNRGDPLFLDGVIEERKEILSEILDQYKKIGEIYEQLGITGADGNA